jgi:hypothetical protein
VKKIPQKNRKNILTADRIAFFVIIVAIVRTNAGGKWAFYWQKLADPEDGTVSNKNEIILSSRWTADWIPCFDRMLASSLKYFLSIRLTSTFF